MSAGSGITLNPSLALATKRSRRRLSCTPSPEEMISAASDPRILLRAATFFCSLAVRSACAAASADGKVSGASDARGVAAFAAVAWGVAALAAVTKRTNERNRAAPARERIRCSFIFSFLNPYFRREPPEGAGLDCGAGLACWAGRDCALGARLPRLE